MRYLSTLFVWFFLFFHADFGSAQAKASKVFLLEDAGNLATRCAESHGAAIQKTANPSRQRRRLVAVPVLRPTPPG